MRYRFPKAWCSACKLMQYPGECGHRYLEAPSVHPVLVNWAVTGSDRTGLRRAVLDQILLGMKLGTKVPTEG